MGRKRELTAKQKIFVDEYIKTGNATQAVFAAGYSASNSRIAATMGATILARDYVQEKIQAKLKKMEEKRVASAEEVMIYLTSVMRGESQSSELVVEGSGGGFSQAREVSKKPSEAERLKAAAMLAKRFNLHMTSNEYNERLKRLQLENEKLQAEIDRLKGGSDEAIDDGFIAALSGTAAKDWSDD